ncbi:transposase-like zinc-binding domain-containing protein [Trueperella pyogenes]
MKPLSSRAHSCPLCSQSMKKNGKNSSGTQRWYCPKCRWKRHRPIHDPVFSPYLGRKAFAPVFPFVLGMGDASAIYEIPTLRKPKRHPEDTATLSFSLYSPELPTQRHLSQVPVVHSRQSWLDAVREKLTPLS